MNSQRSNVNQFPEFFTTKGSIPLNTTHLKFGKRTYFQATVSREGQQGNFNQERPSLRPYLDNDEELLDCTEMDDNYDIILTKSGKFQTSFYVPSTLLSYIIGAKGMKLKALQRNTNTLIKVPRVNEKGDIIVIGDTERKVASARTQIALIVAQRKERLSISHFIGIRIDSEEIKQNFSKFKENILQEPPRGVTESVFQVPYKLHLTLVGMTILDDEELELAKKTLESFHKEVVLQMMGTNKSHEIICKGLEIMNDDPTEVNVLFAKVQMETQELSDALQQMSDKMLNYFFRAGVAKKQYDRDRVKLHLTLMNTSFKSDEEGQAKFDASQILDKYGDFYFGKCAIHELQLLIRGTTEGGKFYESALNVPL